MRLSVIFTCALFGRIFSAYGTGIALVPLMTGLFKRDASQLITDVRAVAVVHRLLQMADGRWQMADGRWTIPPHAGRMWLRTDSVRHYRLPRPTGNEARKDPERRVAVTIGGVRLALIGQNRTVTEACFRAV